MSLRIRLAASLRRGEAVAALVLLLLACGVVWQAARMPPGTLGAPGPGAFPGALGVLLAAICIGLLVRAWRMSAAEDESIVLGHRDIALTLAALVVLGLLFEWLGFVLSAGLFMLVLFRAFAPLRWIGAIVAAAATAAVSYIVFVRLLGVSLPAGVLPLS
jgi:putative tricarboxylic transport membrane protein